MQLRITRMLLFVFLMQTMQLGDLAKTPLLIRHFIQHKHLYPSTTVLGFIKMHYLDTQVVDADYAEDMQLPFKTIDTQALVIQLYMPPEVFYLKNTFAFLLHPALPQATDNLLLPHRNSIFQPPKIA